MQGHSSTTEYGMFRVLRVVWNGFFFKILFIYFWLHYCFLCAFSSFSEWGLLSSCGSQASHCGGFSYRRAWALIASQHVGSSCTRDQTVYRGPTALAGGFLTTEPPGKSPRMVPFIHLFVYSCWIHSQLFKLVSDHEGLRYGLLDTSLVVIWKIA